MEIHFLLVTGLKMLGLCLKMEKKGHFHMILMQMEYVTGTNLIRFPHHSLVAYRPQHH